MPDHREATEPPHDLKSRVRRYEAALITEALRAAGGSQTRAAAVLDVPLRTLVHKIRKLGIQKRDYLT